MNNIENKKIEEYLTKLQSMKKQDFLDETKQIKNRISSKMAYYICDEVNRTYNTKSFNPEKINEIISFSLEILIDKYKKEITSDLEEMPQDDIKRKRQVQHENTMVEITNKMITDVNAHIKFKEALANLNYGRGYHSVPNANEIRRLDELELIIRQCIKKNTIQLNEMIEDMYNAILKEYEKRKQDFFDNTVIAERGYISPNEAAFIDSPSRTLDPNVIFGEPVVSKNESAFIDSPSRTLDPNVIFGEPVASKNEAAFIDIPSRTLDPNVIFGEPIISSKDTSFMKDLPDLDPNCIFENYESENAKKFR